MITEEELLAKFPFGATWEASKTTEDLVDAWDWLEQMFGRQALTCTNDRLALDPTAVWVKFMCWHRDNRHWHIGFQTAEMHLMFRLRFVQLSRVLL